MAGGKETTTVNRSPGFEDFMAQIFGSQGGVPAGYGLSDLLKGGADQLAGYVSSQGQPGVGIGNIEQMFGGFGAPVSPLQRQATNQMGQFLNQQSPEVQAFNLGQQGLSDIITGEGQFGNIAEAFNPIFDRNLSEVLAQTQSALPSVFNRAAGTEVANVGQRALQDYNLFIESARQQDIANRTNAALGLGTLASSAGQNPFMRALQAGQFGAQQGQFQQGGQLAMQMQLMQMLGMPTGQTTQFNPGFFDYFSAAAGAGGAAAGAFG